MVFGRRWGLSDSGSVLAANCPSSIPFVLFSEEEWERVREGGIMLMMQTYVKGNLPRFILTCIVISNEAREYPRSIIEDLAE
jgi:hypothetical protein